MHELPDSAARTRALDPETSFIVQAPAGSGKTELLVRRFLVLLAVVEEPEEILAITFTRKAAAEMRARIIERLDSGPTEDAGLAVLVSRALQRDRDRGWSLLDNPGRLRVMTVDGFNQYLVSSLPWSSRSAASQPAEHVRPLYEQAAWSALLHVEDPGSRWRGDARVLLEHVGANVPRAIRFLVAMLERRDQWTRLVTGFRQGDAGRAALEGAWRWLIDSSLRRLSERLPAVDWGAVASAMIFAETNLGDHGGGCWDVPVTRAEHLDLHRWQSLLRLLLTADGKPRRRFDRRQGFPAGDRETRDRHLQALLDLGRSLHSDATASGLAEEVLHMPSARFGDAQWRVIEAANRLLLLALAELRLLFRDAGRADFIDIAQGALAALGNDQSPTDLALALDYRLRHILVDEFQDTSWGQLELLNRLVAEWQPRDGRSLFLVGDPMQSIYRFRKAEVGIFLQAMDLGIGPVTLEPLRLQASFRAEEPLVNWQNRAFGALMPCAPDALTGAVPHAPSFALHAATGTGAAVRALLGDGADDSAEAISVAEAIDDILAGEPGTGIAVLVRARSHLRAIAAELERRGTPFSALDAQPLADSDVVRDLFSLLRVLVSPADDLAWLALLRGPCCGLRLEELLGLRTPGYEPLALALQEISAELPEEARWRAARLHRIVMESRAHRREPRFRSLLEATFRRLGGFESLAPHQLRDAAAFLDLVDQCGPHPPDTRVLAERLDGLWASPGSVDARVQLMTIHRAKGLEWDVVILPGLHRVSRRDDEPLALWQEVADDDLGGVALHAAVSRRDATAEDSAHYRYLKRLEKARAGHEAARLLYVACTRARRQLLLFGALSAMEPHPRARGGSFLDMLLPHIDAAGFAASARAETAPQRRAAPAARLPREILERIDADRDAPPPTPPIAVERVEYSWAGEVARRVGSALHRALQRIAEEGPDDWHPARLQRERSWIDHLLRNRGLDDTTRASALEECLDSLRLCLGDPRFLWIVDPGHRERRFEWALEADLDAAARQLVLDCSFVADGVRWIIDFKTGQHAGGGLDEFLDSEAVRYRPQLDRYAEALAAMQSLPIRCGLYFPAVSGWREWAAATP